VRREQDESPAIRAAIEFGVDISLLESNLALTPAQRIQELVAMNRLHMQIQMRTLTPEERARLDALELAETLAYLAPGSMSNQ
jgi:hypothetical protein